MRVLKDERALVFLYLQKSLFHLLLDGTLTQNIKRKNQIP